MRKKIAFIVAGLILIPICYMIFKKINNQKKYNEHLEWVETLEHTASKNVHILKDAVNVDYLNEKRTLAIYLPGSYESDSTDYPVIYFLDGQSLYDQKIQEGTEWQVDEVLDSLGSLNQKQAIVVGIYNTDDRLREYKPFPSDRWYSHKRISGDKHAAWVVNTVKPWIDDRYRTSKRPEHTIIGGASLGGLMSYFMLMEYPEIFGGAIVFSPSFWFNEKIYSLHERNGKINDQKIFFNAGELETPTVHSVEKMAQILIEQGVPKENIRVEIEKGEGHWHMSWRKGFKKVYPWIITPKK